MMIFLGSKLATRHHYITSLMIHTWHVIHKVLGVARWIDQCSFVILPPEGANVLICPRTVGGYGICCFAAPRVVEHKDSIVDIFEVSHEEAWSHFVVELIRIYLWEHVAADRWIVGVAHNTAGKEKFYDGVRHAHTYCVNKDIAGFKLHGFDADTHICNHLPKESQAWIVLCFHSVMSS